MERKAKHEATSQIRNGMPLTIAVELWDAHQGHSMPKPGKAGLRAVDLNPAFVEALMGFPSGFVTRSLEPSEMPLFRRVGNSSDT